MATAAESKIVFEARVNEFGLTDVIGKFRERGWMTFSDCIRHILLQGAGPGDLC